jgi:hypothetical protein
VSAEMLQHVEDGLEPQMLHSASLVTVDCHPQMLKPQHQREIKIVKRNVAYEEKHRAVFTSLYIGRPQGIKKKKKTRLKLWNCKNLIFLC